MTTMQLNTTVPEMEDENLSVLGACSWHIWHYFETSWIAFHVSFQDCSGLGRPMKFNSLSFSGE